MRARWCEPNGDIRRHEDLNVVSQGKSIPIVGAAARNPCIIWHPNDGKRRDTLINVNVVSVLGVQDDMLCLEGSETIATRRAHHPREKHVIHNKTAKTTRTNSNQTKQTCAFCFVCKPRYLSTRGAK
jgi:hypothetical protein